MVDAGDPAPDFALEGMNGVVRLSEASAGAPVIVLFYTEDATPACTAQVAAFKADYDLVQEFGARVVAVSADSLESHAAFVSRLDGVPFDIVSDPNLAAARSFGVVDDTGKRARRSVFVVQDGIVKLAMPWFNLSNSAQYQQVFEALGAI